MSALYLDFGILAGTKHSDNVKHSRHGLLSHYGTNIASFVHSVVLNSSGKYFEDLSKDFFIYDISFKTELLHQATNALDCKLPPLWVVVFFRNAAVELNDFKYLRELNH